MAVGDGVVVGEGVGDGVGEAEATTSGFAIFGDAEFEGDVKIQGRSILEILDTIEQRLAILRPDPEKLEHFEALKKAYDNYKMLEALCQLPSKQDENI